jgi:phosphatidylglycerol:prolipoprotein diacylglycerol transferase
VTLLNLEYPQWLSPTLSAVLPLRWYGALIAASLVGIWYLFRHEAQRRGVIGRSPKDRQEQARFFTWTILSGLAGGRVLFVLLEPDAIDYVRQPWLLLWPFTQGEFRGIEGMNAFGSIAGAVAGAALFSVRSRHPFLEWADIAAYCSPLVALGAGIGNFANGEHIGRITTAPWGVRFPNGERLPVAEHRIELMIEAIGLDIHPSQLLVNLPRHPVQLYEALLCGLGLWAVLWLLVRKERLFPGMGLGLTVTAYGMCNALLGYYREADPVMRWTTAAETEMGFVEGVLGLSHHQVAALLLVAAGLLTIVVSRLIYKPAPTIATYEDRQTE